MLHWKRDVRLINLFCHHRHPRLPSSSKKCFCDFSILKILSRQVLWWVKILHKAWFARSTRLPIPNTLSGLNWKSAGPLHSPICWSPWPKELLELPSGEGKVSSEIIQTAHFYWENLIRMHDVLMLSSRGVFK